MTFSTTLSELRAGRTGACKHLVGSASFLDEEEYDQLEQQFDEAVLAFSASDGEPIQPTPRFPGQDVEKAKCWRRGAMILYVVLTFGDNTRMRMLTIGLAHPGTVVALS